MKSVSPWFNAHHAPIGAFATFTLGQPGARGGFGLERGGPADEDVYIGIEDREGGGFHALPFFGPGADDAARYDVEAAANPGNASEGGRAFRPFATTEVERDFGVARDTWRAGDLEFSLHTQVVPVPEPAARAAGLVADEGALRDALIPAVWAELTLDNRGGMRPRRGFFGFAGKDPYTFPRTWEGEGFVAAGQGGQVGIFAAAEPGLAPAQGFSPIKLLHPEHPANARFGLGGTAGIVITVAPGERRTVRFALAFFRGGVVTTGLATRYLYTRWFADLDAVGRRALAMAGRVIADSAAPAALAGLDRLAPDRAFQLAHAVRSYYGSSELLETLAGEPFWVVNEGEYRMMNTFDLTVDHLFFELRLNPWAARNQLDWFMRRYRYTDEVVCPKTKARFPGGVSFTHDMGIANSFSPPEHSAYELTGLHGCFSHMTHEQLVNFILCATLYVKRTGDSAWAAEAAATLAECQASLLVRDHPDPALRNGIMGFDSSRCDGGSEITTYDSLDASLGQARNNLYLAVKSWAACLALEAFWKTRAEPARAAEAAAQASRAAATIVEAGRGRAALPAVLFEGVDSAIIPAVEGLVFPWLLGLREVFSPASPHAPLVAALRAHLVHVLDPKNALCRFSDGGWKLSSTSNNSWLSKIYLCQAVAEQILGVRDAAEDARADAAHVAWLVHPKNAYFAWSDQMLSGVACGSKYYPRGVTGILWLG
jgi:hypothetical protein